MPVFFPLRYRLRYDANSIAVWPHAKVAVCFITPVFQFHDPLPGEG